MHFLVLMNIKLSFKDIQWQLGKMPIGQQKPSYIALNLHHREITMEVKSYLLGVVASSSSLIQVGPT